MIKIFFKGEIKKCSVGYELIESNCYYYSNEKLSWEDAKKSCSKKGGHLIVPSSEKEYNFITEKKENVWIGANDKLKGKLFEKKTNILIK